MCVALAEIVFIELCTVDDAVVENHNVDIKRHYTRCFGLRSTAIHSLALCGKSSQRIEVAVIIAAAYCVGVWISESGVVGVLIYVRSTEVLEHGGELSHYLGYIQLLVLYIAADTDYGVQVHFDECRRVMTVISGVAPMRASIPTVPVPMFTYRL